MGGWLGERSMLLVREVVGVSVTGSCRTIVLSFVSVNPVSRFVDLAESIVGDWTLTLLRLSDEEEEDVRSAVDRDDDDDNVLLLLLPQSVPSLLPARFRCFIHNDRLVLRPFLSIGLSGKTKLVMAFGFLVVGVCGVSRVSSRKSTVT